MELLFIISFVICMAALGSSRPLPEAGAEVFNVLEFGAAGDGVTDDSQAFIKAWNAVCGATSGNPTLIVPPGRSFLLNPISLEGPCKPSGIVVQIDGNLIAPEGPWAAKSIDTWLAFRHVNGFIVRGNGQIDGQGSNWWQCSSQDKDQCDRPTALRFHDCFNFEVVGLKHTNPQRNHISINGCENGTLANLHITAPETSPNTDGIDISGSRKITILNTFVATGDDCVAINTGCFDIDILGMNCGPGHGISVGSLGLHGEKAEVEGIHVKNCTFTDTQNGARIKTWQGGSGFARNITFEDINLDRADHPILIDQFYCPHETCPTEESAVQISDVSFIGFRGTTITKDAIALNCSLTVGCTNIVLDHINILPDQMNIVSPFSSSNDQSNIFSTCINAYGSSNDTIPMVNCLRNN